MRKIINRLLLFALLLATSSIVILLLLGFIYGKEAKTIISEKINTGIKADLHIADVEFSMIRHFPRAGLVLKNVSIIDHTGLWENDTVLWAKSISLAFPYKAFWTKEYQINKMLVEEATVHYLKNKSGLDNFTRFNNGSSGNSVFDLQNVSLSDVRFRYWDMVNGQDIKIEVQKAKCKGLWSKKVFDLETEGLVYSESISIEGLDYLPKKSLSIKAALHIDQANKNYTINNAEMSIENVDFVLSGGWQQLAEGEVLLGFEIGASKAKFADLKKILPEKLLGRISAYDFSGELQLLATVKGNSERPVFTVNALANNAALSSAKTSEKLSSLSFNSTYSSDAGNNKSRLELKDFNAMLGSNPIAGSMIVNDLNNPDLDIYLDGVINLEHLQEFLQIDTLESLSGELLVDARITGETAELKSFRSKGNIEMINASLKVKGKDLDLSGLSGTLTIKGNDVFIKNLEGTTGFSDFLLNGSVNNVYPYFFEGSKFLTIDADLKSKYIDLDQLLLRVDQVNVSDTVYRLDFPEGIALNLNAAIELLDFRKFEGKNIEGKVKLSNRVLTASNLSIDAMEGNIFLKGEIDADSPQAVNMNYDAILSNIDIRQMFFEMGNFGQDVIASENLEGRITAEIKLKSVWTKELHCDMEKLSVFSAYKIENGELIHFEPLNALNKYVKGSQLDHIYFDKIENELTIAKRKIHFPHLEINSSALDIIASGTHDFDNIVDYKVQLLLSQLLGSKVKAQNTEFGEIEDDGLGRTKLFLTMKGPLNDPEIKLDTEAIQNKIASEIRQEKQNLKAILKEEFGRDNNVKVSAGNNKTKPKEELEIEFETEDVN